MPITNFALKTWQKISRNFGIHATQVRVSSHWPWHWYAYATLAAILLILLTSVLLLRYVINPENAEKQKLQERIVQLEQQLETMRKASSTENSDLLIATSTQKSLMEKLSFLEKQNANLKEDIIFYEKVGIKGYSEPGLHIQRARVERDASSPQVYRYRLLISFNGKGKEKVFKGNLRFNVTGHNKNGNVNLVLPYPKDIHLTDYLININNSDSKEGSFEVPPDTIINKVEILIMRGEEVQTKQTVQVQ